MGTYLSMHGSDTEMTLIMIKQDWNLLQRNETAGGIRRRMRHRQRERREKQRKLRARHWEETKEKRKRERERRGECERAKVNETGEGWVRIGH